jgi:hypothetical protein
LRRSHRFALSALCALVALVVAGRLATSAVAREGRAPGATASRHSRHGNGDASELAVRDAQRGSSLESTTGEAAVLDAGDASRAAARDASRNRARGAERRSGASAPIALDDPQIALGTALSVAGHDAGGPRAIEVWRIAGARAARVAVGASRADGSLDLPALILPAGEVTLVAAPRGEGAASPDASPPVVVSRDPSTPGFVGLHAAAAEAELVVTIEPAEPVGSIVVASASEQEIGRAAVVVGADAAPVSLEISVALGADDDEFLVAQEIPDGRRSPWRRVAIARETQGD